MNTDNNLLGRSFQTLLRYPLRSSFYNSLQLSISDSLGYSLWIPLRNSLYDQTWRSLYDSLRYQQVNAVFRLGRSLWKRHEQQ